MRYTRVIGATTAPLRRPRSLAASFVDSPTYRASAHNRMFRFESVGIRAYNIYEYIYEYVHVHVHVHIRIPTRVLYKYEYSSLTVRNTYA